LYEAATSDLFKYLGLLGESLKELRIVIDGIYTEILNDLANYALAKMQKLEKLTIEKNYGGYNANSN
jgi:Ran GTPase-activating protein (RanGAP) involved in mRNA processing and transport